MGGPALPTNIDASNPDSADDPSWKLHQQYHDLIHAIVNLFDKDVLPTAAGQVPTYDPVAGTYKPATPSASSVPGLRASDPFPTDSQAVAAYGEGGLFTVDEPYVLASRGSSNDATSEIIGALSFNRSVGLDDGTFLVSGPLGDTSGLTGKGQGRTIIQIRSTYGGGQRVVSDGVTTLNSTTVSSATGGFSSGHVGRRINGTNIPANTTITAVAGDGKSATMSAAATASGTGITIAFGEPLIRALKGANIGRFTIRGGPASNTCLTNPDIGVAIGLGLGAANVTVRDVDYLAVNGWAVQSLGQIVGAPYYMVVDGLRGTYTAGGIHILGVSSSNFGAQVTIDHVNFQVVERYSILWFDSVNDVQVGKVNGAVSGLVAGAYSVRISGNSSTITFDSLNVGSIALPGIEPTVIIGDTGTPNNIWINSGVAQSGENGVRVIDGFNLHFRLQVSRSASDGFLVVSGDNIDLCGVTFTRNGYRAVQTVTDGVTTSGSTTVTSASAQFTSAHKYRKISGSGLPSANGGNYIVDVVSPTQVTVSQAATASGTGVSLTIGSASDLRVLDSTADVRVALSDFTTPVGNASQQVSNPVSLPGSTNLVLVEHCRFLGGHAPFQSGYLTGGTSVFTGGTPKFARGNLGYNPVGPLPLPSVPASGGSTSGSAVNQWWVIQAGGGGTTTIQTRNGPAHTAGVIDPSTVTLIIPAGAVVTVFQPAGTVLQFTYTSAPTILARTGD